MKRYLITMGVLLLTALCAGIAVWFFYQDLNAQTRIERSYPEEKRNVDGSALSTTTSEDTDTGSIREPVPSEPVTITAGSLSEDQREMLETYGLDSSEYTITEVMIECSKEKVGEGRLREILNGAAPTPLEAMSLIPCMKR